MRSKTEILQEYYSVGTWREALKILKDDSNKPLPPLSDTTKLKLPYEALSQPRIPSIDEIKQAIVGSSLTRVTAGFDVCRVGMTVVKIGYHPIIVEEAENLLFLQAHSQVRTPKVYAVFAQSEDIGPRYYLVMEFIEGDMLDYIKWIGLTEEERTIICSKLAEQLHLLRSIPSEGYYGRVHNLGWRRDFRLLRSRKLSPSGPYKTYEDCISAMYRSAELQVAMSNITEDLHPIQETLLSKFRPTLTACNGQELTLTHLDPALRNIIVRRVEGPEHVSDWEVTLIDWADMGWLPAWMQAVALDQRVCMFHGYKTDEHAKEQFIEKVTHAFQEPYTEQKSLFMEMYDICYGIM